MVPKDHWVLTANSVNSGKWIFAENGRDSGRSGTESAVLEIGAVRGRVDGAEPPAITAETEEFVV